MGGVRSTLVLLSFLFLLLIVSSLPAEGHQTEGRDYVTYRTTLDNENESTIVDGYTEPGAPVTIVVHSPARVFETRADIQGYYRVTISHLEPEDHTVKVISGDANGNRKTDGSQTGGWRGFAESAVQENLSAGEHKTINVPLRYDPLDLSLSNSRGSITKNWVSNTVTVGFDSETSFIDFENYKKLRAYDDMVEVYKSAETRGLGWNVISGTQIPRWQVTCFGEVSSDNLGPFETESIAREKEVDIARGPGYSLLDSDISSIPLYRYTVEWTEDNSRTFENEDDANAFIGVLKTDTRVRNVEKTEEPQYGYEVTWTTENTHTHVYEDLEEAQLVANRYDATITPISQGSWSEWREMDSYHETVPRREYVEWSTGTEYYDYENADMDYRVTWTTTENYKNTYTGIYETRDEAEYWQDIRGGQITEVSSGSWTGWSRIDYYSRIVSAGVYNSWPTRTEYYDRNRHGATKKKVYWKDPYPWLMVGWEEYTRSWKADTDYKLTWATVETREVTHSKTYETRGQARESADAHEGTITSFVDKSNSLGPFKKKEYEKSRFYLWGTPVYTVGWIKYGRSWESDTDYKVSWTITYPHSERYSDRTAAEERAEEVSGSVERYVVDADYTVNWKRDHIEYYDDLSTAEERAEDTGGKITDKELVDTDYTLNYTKGHLERVEIFDNQAEAMKLASAENQGPTNLAIVEEYSLPGVQIQRGKFNTENRKKFREDYIPIGWNPASTEVNVISKNGFRGDVSLSTSTKGGMIATLGSHRLSPRSHASTTLTVNPSDSMHGSTHQVTVTAEPENPARKDWSESEPYSLDVKGGEPHSETGWSEIETENWYAPEPGWGDIKVHLVDGETGETIPKSYIKTDRCTLVGAVEIENVSYNEWSTVYADGWNLDLPMTLEGDDDNRLWTLTGRSHGDPIMLENGGNIEVTAYYERFTLEVLRDGPGKVHLQGGELEVEGAAFENYDFMKGTLVTLKSHDGFFDEWTDEDGAKVLENESIIVPIDEDKTRTAHFKSAVINVYDSDDDPGPGIRLDVSPSYEVARYFSEAWKVRVRSLEDLEGLYIKELVPWADVASEDGEYFDHLYYLHDFNRGSDAYPGSLVKRVDDLSRKSIVEYDIHVEGAVYDRRWKQDVCRESEGELNVSEDGVILIYKPTAKQEAEGERKWVYVDFVTRTTGEVALYGHNPRTSENTKLASDNLPVRIDWYGQGNLTAPAVDLGADLSDCGTVRGIREGVKDWATKKDAVDKLLEDYLGLSSSAYIHTGMEVTIDWEGDGAMDRTFYIPESELRDAWRAK